MAKPIKQIVKVQAPAGKAVPGQSLGPVLGGAGVNIMEFIKAFNERTQSRAIKKSEPTNPVASA